jgi:hypothetical protein
MMMAAIAKKNANARHAVDTNRTTGGWRSQVASEFLLNGNGGGWSIFGATVILIDTGCYTKCNRAVTSL